ncbi:amino acid adenylation domain-containing protein [Salmonella enterica]|nr:amino acid adenylation domain-containing protein [Salmonella enterica]
MTLITDSAKKIGLKISNFEGPELANAHEGDVVNKLYSFLEGMALPFPNERIDVANFKEYKKESFPLTDLQYAYLIGRNAALPLGGISPIHYIEIKAFNIDIKKLNNALTRIIEIHPAMRLVLTDNGRQQFIPSHQQYHIQEEDYSHLESTRLDQKLSLLRNNITEHIDNKKKNIWSFDIHATILKDNYILLHLCFDLMFFDIISINIIIKDLWNAYNDVSFKYDSLSYYFPLFIETENKLKQTDLGLKDKKFWMERLIKIPSSPELPLYKSPELIKKHKFITLTKIFSLDLLNKLQRQAVNRGITLETLFLGAYVEVIRQWSRHQNFTLTLTLNGRRNYSDEIKQTVGNFLQPSLLCVNSNEDKTFIDRLVDVQTELLVNRWYSTFNGIQVLREMTRLQNDGRAISMPIVFSNTLNSELRHITKDHSWEGSAQTIYTATQTPGVWLENQLMRINGNLVMCWNYVEDLFPEGMPEAMFDATLKLLNDCCEVTNIWSQKGSVVQLPLQDKLERVDANATTKSLKLELLHEPILAAAKNTPEKVAIIQGDIKVTYSELVNTACYLAKKLNSIVKINPGDIIAVSINRGPEMLSAILSILLSGAAYVYIDPFLPEQRKIKLLDRCNAKALFTSSDNKIFHPIIIDDIKIITLSDNIIYKKAYNSSLNDLAYIIFTSGSTGEPKGVMITHHNAANTIIDINSRFGINSQDTIYSIVPPGFDLSVYDYFGILSVGGTILFPKESDPSDPDLWAKNIIKYDVTVWNTVPSPAKALFDSTNHHLKYSTLRLVLMSGDWIPVDLPSQIQKISDKIQIISLGGATEGAIWSIIYPIVHIDPAWKSIPYGKPLTNQRFHVLNEWLSDCPKWVTGELYIAGDGVAKGYLGDKVKTNERFFEHPYTGERLYRTGDLGRYISNGVIEIRGREDNQVKINGYRIELGEIEAAILTHPSVKSAVINSFSHPKTGQKQLAAYIVVLDSIDNNIADFEGELRDFLSNLLPSYMIPNWILRLNDIPLTANGKIDRKALPSIWLDHKESMDKCMPENENETRLYSIWISQLQHSDFGVTDGFFDIGGDSLHAVSLLSIVRREFNITPSCEQNIIESLFMNASIRDFSKIITNMSNLSKEEDYE